MKITDAEISEYFDVPPRTLADWKTDREKRYIAMKHALRMIKHYRQLEEAKKALDELEG